MRHKEPFYTRRRKRTGILPGWIDNSQIAEELAYIEKDGRDKALRYEKVLEECHMNPIEAENTTFVDLLLTELPHLFKEGIDEETKERYIVTSHAIFSENTSPQYNCLLEADVDFLYDLFHRQDFIFLNTPSLKPFYYGRSIIVFSKHGCLITERTDKPSTKVDEPSNVSFDYVPSHQDWENIRDINPDKLKKFLQVFAFYERIGDQIDELFQENIGEAGSIGE